MDLGLEGPWGVGGLPAPLQQHPPHCRHPQGLAVGASVGERGADLEVETRNLTGSWGLCTSQAAARISPSLHAVPRTLSASWL